MAEECHQAGDKQAGLGAHHEVLGHRKPLMWFKGGLCSLNEFEPFTEVTASILGIQILASEEGRGRRGMGRLLLQRSVSGEAERALCFMGLVLPLIPQYL